MFVANEIKFTGQFAVAIRAFLVHETSIQRISEDAKKVSKSVQYDNNRSTRTVYEHLNT